MAIKIFLTGFLFLLCLFVGGYRFVAAESENEGESEQEIENQTSSEVSGAASEGESNADTGAGAVVPAEIQQQLDGIQKTIDTAQSVKERGLLQTIWDNITAPFVAIFQQIGQILDQIATLLGG